MNKFSFTLVQRHEMMVNGQRQIKLTFCPHSSDKSLSAGGKIVMFFAPNRIAELEDAMSIPYTVGEHYTVSFDLATHPVKEGWVTTEDGPNYVEK